MVSTLGSGLVIADLPIQAMKKWWAKRYEIPAYPEALFISLRNYRERHPFDFDSFRAILLRITVSVKAIRSARHLNKLWKDWIANISISTSFIGHKRDPTVRVIANLSEGDYFTDLLKNVASDGNIRGPSEGYPEMINVWKEMEKLLDTGASCVLHSNERIIQRLH